MAGQNEETLDPEMEQVPIDPWAAAFAELDKKNKEDIPSDVDGVAGDGVSDRGRIQESDLRDTEGDDDGEGAASPESEDGAGVEGLPGGSDSLGGEAGEEDEGFDWDGIDISEESITNYRTSTSERIQEQTIKDVAAAYIRQGARHDHGKLGASINDPDVCKRDRDGVPRFYNPETGREFTGDNPRRQAQEWVDDYNRELRDNFNKTCQAYSKQLLEQEAPKLAVIEFAPKYQQLDPVRRAMFESLIEDYEVRENGNIVGYSCDLDKALAAVNRQVSVIQKRYAGQQAKPVTPPSGPVLDTPSTAGGSQGNNSKPQFKSLAEAMEWEQDQLLAKMRGKK
jgi:hypothetical protein